jgi:hypothetical protein
MQSNGEKKRRRRWESAGLVPGRKRRRKRLTAAVVVFVVVARAARPQNGVMYPSRPRAMMMTIISALISFLFFSPLYRRLFFFSKWGNVRRKGQFS